MASMKDISEVCGVSIATVSKALNDHTDIGEKTKQHIREVAKQLGYSPNAAAKALKTRRSYNLGILFVDKANNGLTHEHFSLVLDFFKQKVESKGYDITFISTNTINHASYLEHAKYRGFDGVLIACVDFDDPEVKELAASDIPMVTVDYAFPNHTTVISNDEQGIRDLLNYCYQMGHRRIAYVYGGASSVTDKRLGAFRRTAAELGLDLPEEYLLASEYRKTDPNRERTLQLLALPKPPTCIFYPDDFAALGGIDAITTRGLRIPDDISVVGYDGVRWTRHLTPHLTTLRQNAELIGTTAAEKLIETIEHPKESKVAQIIIDGKVYVGGSVKRLS
ncbi:MAG: LacI family DNA-binding transcriptional regulator [Lachnospiraceae bacterium]|nr:LacI family DNA-binding transcriptional regulator [Lachnospiraceae bacterium]